MSIDLARDIYLLIDHIMQTVASLLSLIRLLQYLLSMVKSCRIHALEIFLWNDMESFYLDEIV